MRSRKRKFEPFLNPPHKRLRLKLTRKATKRKRKRNSMAMIVGNPRKRGGVIRMAKRRRRRSLRKRNPRRFRSIFRAAKRRRKNPTYGKRWSRRRRNPIVGGAKMEKLTTVLIGALSAIAVTAVPNFIKANTTLMKLGSQAATVLLGGFLVGKMLRSTEKGFVWSLVGGSVIVADLLKTYVLKGLLPSAGLEGFRGNRLGQHYYLPAPAAGMPGYYVPEQDYSVVPLGPF